MSDAVRICEVVTMKIDSKNKRKAYNNYLARSGAGLASKYTPRRQLPASAVNQMKHKPYGGMDNEQEHIDASIPE